MSNTTAKPRLALLIAAFAAVYIFWGSTYLAIKYAIETLPPFLMAGTRFVVAGGILLVVTLLPIKLVQLGIFTSKLSLGQRPIGGRAGKIPAFLALFSVPAPTTCSYKLRCSI